MIRAVIEQHAEEVACLWVVRDAAAASAHYDLASLAELDDRLDANLDALRIAGRGGLSVCRRALELGDAGEVFAVGVLAFEGGDEGGAGDALEAASSPERARGLVSALGWLPFARAEGAIGEMLSARDAAVRRAGLAASLAHRRDPGAALDAALVDEDERLRARALRAIGELGRHNRAEDLRAALRGDGDDARFWAAWSAALVGDKAGAPALQSACEREGPNAERAAAMAVRRMKGEEASGWLRALAERPDLRRAAVIGAGARGDPADVPWLLEQMAAPELARVAGEALTFILGIDMDDFRAAAPEGYEGGPSDDADDEDVRMDPDAPLPWPDVDLLVRFWGERGGAWKPGVRYLLGQPISAAWAQRVLWEGSQRQRAAAAIELAMSEPGKPLVEVRAPGFRQAS